MLVEAPYPLLSYLPVEVAVVRVRAFRVHAFYKLRTFHITLNDYRVLCCQKIEHFKFYPLV